MALCSVADIKAHVTPSSLTDAEITAIIASASEEVALTSGGSASSTNANLKIAGIHASVAQVLRRMQTNGELAASVRAGNYQQQNSIEQLIGMHELKAEKFVQVYKVSSISLTLSSGRMGIGTVNNEL